MIFVNSEGWIEKPHGELDPRVGAVDRGAERGEDRQDQQHRDAVEDRDGPAQRAVAEPDRADHQGEADACVEGVPQEEEVRVALGEVVAVAGRGPHEQGTEEGERQRGPEQRPVEPPYEGVAGGQLGPGALVGAVAGDGESTCHQGCLPFDAGDPVSPGWPPGGRGSWGSCPPGCSSGWAGVGS